MLRMIPGSLLEVPATLRMVLFRESAMKSVLSDVTAIPLRSLRELRARSSSAAVAAPPSPRDPAWPAPAIAESAADGVALTWDAAAAGSAKTRFGKAAFVRSAPARGSRARARAATPVAMTIAFVPEDWVELRSAADSVDADCPAANADASSLCVTPKTIRIPAANAQMPSNRRTSSPSIGMYRRFGFTCRRSGCVSSRPSYQRRARENQRIGSLR